jgi:uncharacterized membrane protein YkoI
VHFDWRRVFAVSALTLFGSPVMAESADDKIDLAKVPGAAVQAAQTAVPNARLTHAYKEVEDGRTTYEVCGRDSQGRAVEIEVSARGAIRRVETAITAREVPKAVLDALRAKAQGMKLTKAEIVTRNGRLIGYEFEGENAEGDDVEVTVTPDGRAVEVDVVDDDA